MSSRLAYGLSDMSEPRTLTVDVPDAVLRYDIHDAEGGSDEPMLLMIGLPMAADGFGALAGHFPERTIVTYDPRGVGRSERTDGASESNPEQHADDLHRLISALDSGPVEIFGSSGGAVVGLALVSRYPEQVRTLVAHEPPAAPVLPDRDEALAATEDIHATYERDGFGPAMGKFLALTMHKGPIPADFPNQPPMDPAMFGLPTEDDGTRDDALLGQNIVGTTHYEHDFEALRAASTRIVIGAGAESEGEFANRAAYAVAERLGKEVVVFPSHHGGFVGGESGWRGEPEAFAVTLHEVLAES
jgi:pimeloyl-ACP methyl ester carboxylesterase